MGAAKIRSETGVREAEDGCNTAPDKARRMEIIWKNFQIHRKQ